VKHWTERYGEKEVTRRYFEVWNEPNLKGGFFTGTQQDYFKLYKETALAIKSVSANYRVGGPATAGNAWVPEMIDFCGQQKAPIDFISTHDYGVTKEFLDATGDAGTMSYWTFTDIFEEAGPRTTPFHGGFGLMNEQDIKKPAYYAFKYLNELGTTELQCSDSSAFVCKDSQDDVQALIWNFTIDHPGDSVHDDDQHTPPGRDQYFLSGHAHFSGHPAAESNSRQQRRGQYKGQHVPPKGHYVPPKGASGSSPLEVTIFRLTLKRLSTP